MDERAQRDGETRVRRLLVSHLERMGLIKPGGMTKTAYEAMHDEICQRLAYMSEGGLEALAEEMSGRGGGKEADRFPLAIKVLEVARQIEPPREDASPLIRKVFASPLGEAAMGEGWGPELLAWLQSNRRWPGQFVCGQIRDAARDSMRRAADLEARQVHGSVLSEDEVRWINVRQGVTQRAQRARDLGLTDATARAHA